MQAQVLDRARQAILSNEDNFKVCQRNSLSLSLRLCKNMASRYRAVQLSLTA